MSQKERDAFVAGWNAGQYEAENGDRMDGALDPKDEALRRYPDPAPQEKRYRCT
jgi:hypothetical protein